MPRRFAPLMTSIWADEDFQVLSPMAQRMYLQVLSQKRLSLCGVVPYSPRNWARGCDDLVPADIVKHLAELVDHDYVWIDHDTEELVVRTMIKHDPPRGSRSIAGMWNDWREIDSEAIKLRLIHSIPAEIWDHEGVDPPDEAKALRDAPCIGASEEWEPIETGSKTIENEEGAASFPLPPSDCPLPPSSLPDSVKPNITPRATVGRLFERFSNP